MENKALGNVPNNCLCSLLWGVWFGAAYSFALGKAAVQQGGSRYSWKFECWFFLHRGITDELKVRILRSVFGRDWGWGLGEHQHGNKRKTVRFRAVPCSRHSHVEWALQVLLSVPTLACCQLSLFRDQDWILLWWMCKQNRAMNKAVLEQNHVLWGNVKLMLPVVREEMEK